MPHPNARRAARVPGQRRRRGFRASPKSDTRVAVERRRTTSAAARGPRDPTWSLRFCIHDGKAVRGVYETAVFPWPASCTPPTHEEAHCDRRRVHGPPARRRVLGERHRDGPRRPRTHGRVERRLVERRKRRVDLVERRLVEWRLVERRLVERGFEHELVERGFEQRRHRRRRRRQLREHDDRPGVRHVLRGPAPGRRRRRRQGLRRLRVSDAWHVRDAVRGELLRDEGSDAGRRVRHVLARRDPVQHDGGHGVQWERRLRGLRAVPDDVELQLQAVTRAGAPEVPQSWVRGLRARRAARAWRAAPSPSGRRGRCSS